MTDNHSSTRVLRRMVGTALAAATLMAACAAAPAAAQGAPFTPSQWITDFCQPGSTCRASSAASADGTQVSSASVDRPAVTEANESIQGVADGSLSGRLPEGTGAVRVSFSWRVDSAATAANSTAMGGTAVGRVFAKGVVSCAPDCVVTDDTSFHGVLVASTFSRFGPVPPEQVTLPGSIVTHTVTVRGRDGATLRKGTNLTMAGRTIAFAYVGGPCFSDGCDITPHSGTASATARLQLLSIDVTRDGGTPQPLLLVP